jgi:ADP-ribosylglycohydrolase
MEPLAPPANERPADTPGGPEDRFLGLLFGAALGTAVALPCEGRDARVLRENHERDEGKGLEYPRTGEGASVRGYPENDWTGDFDQAILSMWALRVAGPGPPFDTGLARLIVKWTAHGLSDLGDTKPVGVDAVTFRVVGHPEFLTNPSKSARETVGGGRLGAGRLGAAPLIRILPLAALPQGAVLDTVPRATAVTHSDPQVVAAATFVALLLAPLVGGQDPSPERVRFPIQKALQAIVDVDQRKAFRRTFYSTTTLEEAELEFSDSAGHAPKTVRVALWAYRQLLKTPKAKRGPELFRELIKEVALCGRNATEHAAVAGAVLGAALGLSGLPPAWVAGLPNRGWVEAEARDYLSALTAPAAQ